MYQLITKARLFVDGVSLGSLYREYQQLLFPPGGDELGSPLTHVAGAFGNNKSTHSLRKGGAVFYARHGASEDATRQQSGWRASEVMSAIYTKLSTSEVEREIAKTACTVNSGVLLQELIAGLGDISQTENLNKHNALTFLDGVASHRAKMTTSILKMTSIGKIVRALTKHVDERVRSRAAEELTLLRS